MINKKMEWLRIGIFLLIAFVPTYIAEIILNEKYGFENWFFSTKYQLIAMVIIGFSPAIANVITRLITKEGFSDSYLHLRLKGNIKKYLLAAVLPVVMGIASGIITSAVFGKVDFGDVFDKISPLAMAGNILIILSTSTVIAWITFGEEFGWRAYLYPKMEKLIGTPATCIIGGIIWGLWHAPLTVCGHNFGTENWGHPWTSIGLMAIFCVSVGVFLMWVTKKTGSIYPAAIFHSVLNNGGLALAIDFISGMDEYKGFVLENYIVFFSPYLVIGIPFFILLCCKGKK